MRNHKVITALLSALIMLSGIDPALGQGGTGRETPKTSPPTKTAPPAKTTGPPSRNTRASRYSSCSAHSPTAGTGRVYVANLRGVRLEMVEIPAGSFCMGSTNGDAD